MPTVMIRIPYLIDAHHIGDLFGPFIASFLQHGYAVVWEYERGRFFSEGTYTFLVRTAEDGFDTIKWITGQPWSNGKVGAIGCSSSAEEQHRLNAANIPGLAAVVPMGSGAGIGHVGPYNEMGNFYRGGAVHLAGWVGWYDGVSSGQSRSARLPGDVHARRHDPDPQAVEHDARDPDESDRRSTPPCSTLPINQIMNMLGAPHE